MSTDSHTVDHILDIQTLPDRTKPEDISTLLGVAEAWHGHDDWGMPDIYIGTLIDLARALRNGADPTLLADHADHVRPDCDREGCATRLGGFPQ